MALNTENNYWFLNPRGQNKLTFGTWKNSKIQTEPKLLENITWYFIFYYQKKRFFFTYYVLLVLLKKEDYNCS